MHSICLFAAKKIGILFGASESANAEVIKYLPWFLATILFLCFSRMTATYFYATEKNVLAYIPKPLAH